MQLFDAILPALFRSRPNRFVVECDLEGRRVRAYLPNPGRLWELFLPGAVIFLTVLPDRPDRKMKYLVVAVERDGETIMLHTHRTNDVAAELIRAGLVPGLENAEIVQPEYRIGNSRFDFLLKKGGRDVLLEVKSCTLVHRTLAMFPDAISARATKHLQELEHLARRGRDAAVLFIVHSSRARYFMPEHHTDLEFCRALLSVREQVAVRALGVEWTRGLSLCGTVRNLMIPWELVEREAHDRGCYIVILRLGRDRVLNVGALGKRKFSKGYYCYAGSALQHLTQRLERHRRLLKNKHWHIDYLREQAHFHAAIPIRSSADLECLLAARLASISGWSLPGFGSSDCRCPSHLFGFGEDPLRSPAFIGMLLDFRMGRLEEELAAGQA